MSIEVLFITVDGEMKFWKRLTVIHLVLLGFKSISHCVDHFRRWTRFSLMMFDWGGCVYIMEVSSAYNSDSLFRQSGRSLIHNRKTLGLVPNLVELFTLLLVTSITCGDRNTLYPAILNS